MSMGTTPDERLRTSALSEFILAHRDEVMAEWEAAVRALPGAREVSHPVLVDSVPKLLESIARGIVARGAEDLAAPKSVVEEHAFQRLDTGFDLGQVVAEYSLLRDAIMRLWERDGPPRPERTGYRVLHRAIDDSISLSVERFTTAQARAQRALDRIATASLESQDLDDLLRRLLAVLIETIPAIDTATILLRAGDELRVSATVGLERELDPRSVVKIGEGFAGMIAAEGRPMAVRSASTDPLVQSQAIRERGVRALYGVPLVDGGAVIGVAHIGSLTAYEFAEQDRRLLDALAARATTAIYQHMLRHEAERRAAELTAVVESIPEAVFIADGQHITTCNRRGLELLGVGSLAELPDGHVDVLSFLAARDARTGALIGEADIGFAHALQGETRVSEITIVRRGEERIVRSVVAPIEIAGKTELAVAVMTDVTEERRFERERAELLDRERVARGRAESAEVGERFLSEATAVLNSSLEYERTLERVTHLAVPVLADWCVVFLVGEDGGLRMANLAFADPARRDAAKRLLERRATSRAAPWGPFEAVRTGRAQMHEEITEDMLAAVAEDPEHLEILRSLGISSMIVAPISARSRVFGAMSLAMTRDSGRRYGPSHLELAEHLGRRAGLAIENARLYRDAQEASRVREQVLAIVSHDLRNPLSVVLMSAASTMRRARERQDPWLIKQAEAVHRSASRMERLISDLLDMASIHAGRLKIEPKVQAVGPALREAIDLHQPLALEHGITLTDEIEVDPDTLGRFDRERVLQALSNLLGNALKFCGAGDRITVGARSEGAELHVSVADTGPGMTKAEQRRVFDPYWSAERHGKAGTGLGLFITRGIVEAQGGRIWVDSEPGRGSEFVFTLPRADEGRR